MIKWIFFDVGSTLVDETEAYDHRAREMIAGTNITFREFDDVRISLARQGLDGNSAAIKHFGLTKTPWHSEDEVPYSDAHSTLAALIDKGYKLGIIANQKIGTTERLESWGLRQYFDVIAASAEIGYAKPDKEILEKAGIEKEVVFLGVDYKVEIWAKEELEGGSLSPEDFRMMGKKIAGRNQ